MYILLAVIIIFIFFAYFGVIVEMFINEYNFKISVYICILRIFPFRIINREEEYIYSFFPYKKRKGKKRKNKFKYIRFIVSALSINKLIITTNLRNPFLDSQLCIAMSIISKITASDDFNYHVDFSKSDREIGIEIEIYVNLFKAIINKGKELVKWRHTQ